MADIDLDEAKAVLARIQAGRIADRTSVIPAPQADRKLPDELRVLMDDPQFRAYTEPLERFRVAQHEAMLAKSAKRRAQTDRDGAAIAASVADAIASERLAAGLLTQPQTTTFVTLDTPFLIWQLPRPDDTFFHLPWPDDRDPNPKVTPDVSFKDWHIEPFNSWFKVYVEGIRARTSPPTSRTTCGRTQVIHTRS
jgi:hypothetical protein